MPRLYFRSHIEGHTFHQVEGASPGREALAYIYFEDEPGRRSAVKPAVAYCASLSGQRPTAAVK